MQAPTTTGTISSNTNPDCYLQIRHGKQTIFTDVAEGTSVGELKQIIGNILKIDPEIVRLTSKGQILEPDAKHMIECGISTKDARPQNPFQLEFLLKLDDGQFETDEILPYSTQTTSSNDEQQQQQMGIPS